MIKIMKDIEPGAEYTASTTVNPSNTAIALGSGNLPVFATPAMIALMENAAMNALVPFLEPGESSVGISIGVEHTRATPEGVEVLARAKVTACEGRKADFEITAVDQYGNEIGKGTHSRVVIDAEKFLAKIKK